MQSFKITFSKSAVKEIESLDNQLISKIINKIEKLETSPKPKGSIKFKVIIIYGEFAWAIIELYIQLIVITILLILLLSGIERMPTALINQYFFS